MEYVLGRSASIRLRPGTEARWEIPAENVQGPARSFATKEDDDIVQVLPPNWDPAAQDPRGEYYIGHNSPNGIYQPQMPSMVSYYQTVGHSHVRHEEVELGIRAEDAAVTAQEQDEADPTAAMKATYSAARYAGNSSDEKVVLDQKIKNTMGYPPLEHSYWKGPSKPKPKASFQSPRKFPKPDREVKAAADHIARLSPKRKVCI